MLISCLKKPWYILSGFFDKQKRTTLIWNRKLLSLCLTHLFISVVRLILQDHLPTDLAAVIDNDVHFSPCAEFPLPVGDGGERGDDEEGSSQTHEENLKEERDGLDGLPQPHLISQNTVFPTSGETWSGVH